MFRFLRGEQVEDIKKRKERLDGLGVPSAGQRQRRSIFGAILRALGEGDNHVNLTTPKNKGRKQPSQTVRKW